MAVADLPLLALIKTRMTWLHQRQGVLAENVANSDTPDYVARDLKEPDFSKALREARGGLRAAATHPSHIAAAATHSATLGKIVRSPDGETTATGNAVVLEDQMLKVAETRSDYALVSGLYSRSLSLFRTALGNR